MGCEFARCLAGMAAPDCRNTGEVPPNSEKNNAQAQEDGADGEVDTEYSTAMRAPIGNEETCDDERALGHREQGRAGIDKPEDSNHGSLSLQVRLQQEATGGGRLLSHRIELQ